MNYRALNSTYLKVPKKSELEYDAGEGTVLIPLSDDKVYLHWHNLNGKVVSTYTLTYSTLVKNKLKIINNSSNEIKIHAIKI